MKMGPKKSWVPTLGEGCYVNDCFIKHLMFQSVNEEKSMWCFCHYNYCYGGLQKLRILNSMKSQQKLVLQL